MRLWVVGVALASLTWVAATLVADDGIRQRRRMRADLAALQADNARLTAESARLSQRLTGLQQQPTAQEEAVRDGLGWVRSHDLVLHLGN